MVMMGGCDDLSEYSLCAFDLGQSPVVSETLIAGSYGSHNSIWGDVLVWTLALTDNDIRGYDFSTQQFIEITDDDNSVYQLAARIQGDRVVYQDLRFGTSDPMGNWNHSAVFLYDLTTQTAQQITNQAWISAYPDVYGDIIVWVDYRNCSDPNNKNSTSNVEIWGYNISTDTTFQITDLPGRSKTTPRIWGDKVFVHMYKETSGDAIYMFDLPLGQNEIGGPFLTSAFGEADARMRL